MEVSIVVPAYNEKESIQPLLKQIESVMKQLKKHYEILYIDDGSTDGTYEELLKAKKKYSELRIIRFRRNFGQTAAFSAGFAHSKGNVIVTMDADLQNDPEDIPRLIEKIHEGYDVVCGWRYDRKDNVSKHIVSRLGDIVRRKLTGDTIHDSGCSLKAFKHEAVKDLRLYGETHRFIPAILRWKGFKVTEIKVKHHARKFGVTKYNMKRVFKGFMDVLTIKFWADYSTKPLYFFGSLGFISFLIGILLGAYNLVKYGMGLQVGPTLLLAVFLMITGMQFLIFGLLADILFKTYYDTKNKETYEIEKITE